MSSERGLESLADEGPEHRGPERRRGDNRQIAFHGGIPDVPALVGMCFDDPCLILLQKYHDTNGSRIVIRIGGAYTAFREIEDMLLQKYHDRNGRCIAVHFKRIGVGGRFDSPEAVWCTKPRETHLAPLQPFTKATGVMQCNNG